MGVTIHLIFSPRGPSPHDVSAGPGERPGKTFGIPRRSVPKVRGGGFYLFSPGFSPASAGYVMPVGQV
jgi:hypothetical protein